MYDQLVNLISTVGFPIAVSVYLLVKFEKKLDYIIVLLSEIKEDIAAAKK